MTTLGGSADVRRCRTLLMQMHPLCRHCYLKPNSSSGRFLQRSYLRISLSFCEVYGRGRYTQEVTAIPLEVMPQTCLPPS